METNEDAPATPDDKAAQAATNIVTADTITVTEDDGGSEGSEDESGSDTCRELFPNATSQPADVHELLQRFKDVTAELLPMVSSLDKATRADLKAGLLAKLFWAVAEPPPELSLEECLARPGVYVYVLRCFNIKLFKLDGTPVPGPWFVIKVGKAGPGKAGDGSMEKRLYTEQKEVQKWRGKPDAPKIDLIRDLIMCFVGPEWVAAEDDIRNRLGPALGVGLVEDKTQKAVLKMCKDHKEEVGDLFTIKDGKIKAGRGWSAFLRREGQTLLEKESNPVGPSEFIIMHRDDVEKLQGEFHANRGRFAWGESAPSSSSSREWERQHAWSKTQIDSRLEGTERSEWYAEISFNNGSVIKPLRLKVAWPGRVTRLSGTSSML